MNTNELKFDSVSVIMNTYNENRLYLVQAIEGYLNQEKINVDLIISIVEDDKNFNFIKEKYPNIILCISTKKEHPGRGVKGIFYQLNKATKYIKQDWFCYASSNDVAIKNKLFKELSQCKENKKLVCYSNYIITDSNLKRIRKTNFQTFNYINLLKGNYINDCALINTNLLRQCLPFDNTFNNCGYWKMWLEIYVKYGNVFCFNKDAAFYYRQDRNSLHQKRLKNREKMKLYYKIKYLMIFNHLRKYPTSMTLKKKFRKELPQKKIKLPEVIDVKEDTTINLLDIPFHKEIYLNKTNNSFDIEIENPILEVKNLENTNIENKNLENKNSQITYSEKNILFL